MSNIQFASDSASLCDVDVDVAESALLHYVDGSSSDQLFVQVLGAFVVHHAKRVPTSFSPQGASFIRFLRSLGARAVT